MQGGSKGIEMHYGLWSVGAWWNWFHEGHFGFRLNLQVAQAACSKLNAALASFAPQEEHWRVKVIGDDGLPLDLPEGIEGEPTPN